MKLAYIRDINQCDLLPKLGRKVEPKKPESPEAIRLREVEAFERGVFNAVKAAAEHVGRDTFLKALSSQHGAALIGFDLAAKPDQTVSFADVGEMAEKKAPATATLQDADAAFRAAASRVGNDAASKVWYAVVNSYRGPTPERHAVMVAALEALR